MRQNADIDQLILHELLRSVLFNDDNYILSSVLIPLLPPQTAESDRIFQEAIQDREQSQSDTPPDHASFFSYRAAANAYFKSLQVTLDDLRGSWHPLGFVQLPELFDHSTANSYDEAGIKLTSPSGVSYVPHALQFRNQTVFDGSKADAVTMLNLGPTFEQQGPNAVTITALGGCFSQWSYARRFTQEQASDTLTKTIYFHYACRLLSTRATRDQIICAIQFKSAIATDLDSEEKAILGRTAYYLLYQKDAR